MALLVCYSSLTDYSGCSDTLVVSVRLQLSLKYNVCISSPSYRSNSSSLFSLYSLLSIYTSVLLLLMVGAADTDTDVIYVAASLWKLIFETTLLITDFAGCEVVACAEEDVALCDAGNTFILRWQDVSVLGFYAACTSSSTAYMHSSLVLTQKHESEREWKCRSKPRKWCCLLQVIY